MEKYKVFNDRGYHIGLVLQNGTERVVQRGSYVLLAKEEIEYLTSIAPRLFQGERQLRLEDRALAVELGFVLAEDQPVFDEAFIRKQLGQRMALVKAWLEGITEPFLKDEVCRVAQQMDLPASKLQILQDWCPERPLVTVESE